jgi:hypothetical protein
MYSEPRKYTKAECEIIADIPLEHLAGERPQDKGDTMTPQEARIQADIIRTLSLKEARQLGGILGRVCEASLKEHGWYSYTYDGDKVFVTLKA